MANQEVENSEKNISTVGVIALILGIISIPLAFADITTPVAIITGMLALIMGGIVFFRRGVGGKPLALIGAIAGLAGLLISGTMIANDFRNNVSTEQREALATKRIVNYKVTTDVPVNITYGDAAESKTIYSEGSWEKNNVKEVSGKNIYITVVPANDAKGNESESPATDEATLKPKMSCSITSDGKELSKKQNKNDYVMCSGQLKPDQTK